MVCQEITTVWDNPQGLPTKSAEYWRQRKDHYIRYWTNHDPHEATTEKPCSMCKRVLPSREFTICRSMKDGLGWHCRKCTRRTQIKTKYGIEVDDPLNLGLCQSCDQRPASDVDHDHTCCGPRKACKQCVRGFLCHDCNLILGIVQDQVATLLKIARYAISHRR